jgi:hypothetical protein
VGVNSIFIDNANNIFIGGFFNKTANFSLCPNNSNLVSSSNVNYQDAFLVKYTPTPQASISGADVICSNANATFSLAGIAANAVVNWSVSSNLQIISGQGTTQITVTHSNIDGEWASIQANIAGSCIPTLSRSIWIGRPKIWSTILRNFSDSLNLPSQSSLIVDTLYFQQACFGVVPPRPTYDKVCVSAQGASGVNTFEAEDIIGNASESFGYSSGSQTCSGFLEEGYYEFRIRARNTQCSPVAYSDWILFKIWVIQTEPYCEAPPIEPPDVCYDEWGAAYLCPQGLRYFPNASNGELNVEYNVNYIKLELHNKYGQKVREANLEKHKNKKLQLQDLPNDVYFLHLIDQNGNRVQKQVILQK